MTTDHETALSSPAEQPEESKNILIVMLPAETVLTGSIVTRTDTATTNVPLKILTAIFDESPGPKNTKNKGIKAVAGIDLKKSNFTNPMR